MSKAQLDEAEKLIKSGTFEDDYNVEHELGRGRFAIVKRCVHKQTGKKYAAKVVKKSRSNTHGRSGREQLLMEISILNMSTHPKMVRLYDVFETRGEMQLILEYAEGGDLHRHCIETDIARTEKEICYLIRQILEATRYLHNQKIVHLDLKPDNILLAKKAEVFPEIRLIDFGLSRSLDGPYSQFDIVGTAEYVSPEVLAFDPIDYGSDMWSIGVVTYVLLSGISPFAGDDVMETYANIGCVDYDFDCEEFDEISDAAIDFIEKLLLRDPKQRMSARECLEHDWIKQLDGGVTTEDVIQAQQAKKEALPDDQEIFPLQGDEGFASSSESDTSNEVDEDFDTVEEDEIKSEVVCQVPEVAVTPVEEKAKQEVFSEEIIAYDEESKSNEVSKKEDIKADEESNKIIDSTKEVNGDTPKKTRAQTSKEIYSDTLKKTGTPTSKEVNGNLPNRSVTPKSAISDKMAKFSMKQKEVSPLKEKFSKMTSSKSFDTGFLFKDKKMENKTFTGLRSSKLVKSPVTTSSEEVNSPENSPEIKRKSLDRTAEEDVESSGKTTDIGLIAKDKKTENKTFTSIKSNKLVKSPVTMSSEEVNCPTPDNKLCEDNSPDIKRKSLDRTAEKEIELSVETTDINSTPPTEKVDVVKDVDKLSHNNKKSPVPVPIRKPHEEVSKPSPPETKVKPGGIANKMAKKFGKPEDNSGKVSPVSKATTKFDKKVVNDDSDELMSNVLFKMRSQTLDYDSDEENLPASITTSMISIEEPTEHSTEDTKPMTSKPKSPPPPVACKPKSPVPGKKEGVESPPTSRQDSPVQRHISPSTSDDSHATRYMSPSKSDSALTMEHVAHTTSDTSSARRVVSPTTSPTSEPISAASYEVSISRDPITKPRTPPTPKRESPNLRNVEDTTEIGKTPKSPPPNIASKPKAKMHKKAPEIALKPARRGQSDIKDVHEADESEAVSRVKEEVEVIKTNETEHESNMSNSEAVEPLKPTTPAKVGGGLKFSLNIGGGSKKLNIGPLVSVGDQERKRMIKQVSLNNEPKVDGNEACDVSQSKPIVLVGNCQKSESKPVVVIGNCERIPETPDTNDTHQLHVRPSLATSGKSDSFTRRRSNAVGDDNSHRKTYRRLYVTKVRNSKVYEHDFDINTEAAKIAQRVDKDVLQVEVKLKSTDLRLLP